MGGWVEGSLNWANTRAPVEKKLEKEYWSYISSKDKTCIKKGIRYQLDLHLLLLVLFELTEYQ